MQEPQFAEALVNLANTRVELADFDAAELDYRRALAINPRLANAHYGLGLQHLRRQQQALAARCFQSAVEDDPAHIDAWLDLAECLHVAGDEARAITSAEQALARSPAHAPAHATAQFKLAQYRGEQPDAAPHAMVERLYTSMADTFDEHLTSRLGYRIPALLIAELDTWLTRFPAAWSRRPTALDLGCGTGLFGQQVRPFVATVIGVDLSGPMLARARARDCYDRLIESDIESWLRGSDEIFDLITATDVLIYMGRLDELFARVTARLAPGGRFALSTETPAGFEQDYFLLSTGRYAHGAAYVERLAAENALVVAKRIDTPIRMENGAPLAGHVFILQKG
jgi:predicted TPR repeat methyltransferase